MHDSRRLRFFKGFGFIFGLAAALNAGLIVAPKAWAFTHQMAPSLPREVLSETVPFTFSPNDFSIGDFEAYWVTPPVPGISLKLGAESFEWVRASDLFLLPRGRLIIEADTTASASIRGGQVSNLGFTQSLVAESNWRAEIPVALMDVKENRIHLALNRDGKTMRAEIAIRFRPRPEVVAQRVITDPACSPFRVTAEEISLKENQWAYVGCRFVVSQGDRHRTSTLEIFVYWEGAPEKMRIDGVETPAHQESIWAMSQRAAPGKVRLESATGETIALSYSIAEHLHSGSLGFGIGPYAYHFNAPGAQPKDTVIPLLTIYGSYFYSETLRIVGFNATSFHRNWYSDTGLYVQTEQFKIFDKRYQARILLGGHAIAFRALEKNRFIFGLPQGAELIITDFAKKRHNLSAGSFLFPPIGGKAYYNLWLRWGTPQFFGELNYLAWQETIDDQRIYTRSVGISVGAPLWSFL